MRAGMFLAEGRTDAAIADFSTASRLLPDDARVRIFLAQNLIATGATEEAAGVLREARSLTSDEEEIEEINQLERSLDSSAGTPVSE